MSELPILAQSISTKISDLRRLAQEVGVDVKGLAPQAIYEKLVDALSDQAGVQKAIDSCSVPARALLLDIAWHALGVLPGRTIDGPSGRNPRGPELRKLCEELRAKGLLHSLGHRDYWAEHPGYNMADETARWAAPLLAVGQATAEQRPFFVRPQDPPEATSLEGEWLADLVRIVGELGRKAAGITQSGTIYRRDAERLRRLLTPRRPEQVSEAWRRLFELLPDSSRFGPWVGEAEVDVGLLLWLGFGLGLIEVRDGEIKPDRDWRKRLRRRKPGEIWRRAVRATWELHSGSLAAGYWQVFLGPEAWLLPGRLIGTVMSSPWGLFERREPFEAASLLRCLAQLGALEAASWDGEAAVRMPERTAAALQGGQSPEPDLAGQWTILASGDILVPPDLPPSALAWLETVAKPAKVDVVCTYQISPETLHHAVEAGVKPDEILVELEAGSRTGLPQAARFRIEEWLGRVGRYRFVEAALLVCRTPEDAQLALSVKAVRQEVIEVLGETCLVIPALNEAKVRSALEHAGLAALQGVFSPSGLLREDALKERRKAMRILRSLDWGQGTVIAAL